MVNTVEKDLHATAKIELPERYRLKPQKIDYHLDEKCLKLYHYHDYDIESALEKVAMDIILGDFAAQIIKSHL